MTSRRWIFSFLVGLAAFSCGIWGLVTDAAEFSTLNFLVLGVLLSLNGLKARTEARPSPQGDAGTMDRRWHRIERLVFSVGFGAIGIWSLTRGEFGYFVIPLLIGVFWVSSVVFGDRLQRLGSRIQKLSTTPPE